MHGRGRASWYRPMEIKVYERRKGTAVSVGRLQEWSREFMKFLYPLVKWKGSQRWSDRFHVAEQCKKFWQFVRDKRRERGIETTWIINADQTPLWLEMPATTTVDQTGVRSVPIRSAGYQKERVTVMLACTADGMKLKPWFFFKRKIVLKGVFPPGGVVSWRSKKQNEVGLSSCETEYMALHHGVKEVVWLRRLLEEIGVFQREPTTALLLSRLSDGTGIWNFSFPLRLSHGNSASSVAASTARAASRAAASAAATAAAAAAATGSAAAALLFFVRLLCLSPPASSTSFAGLLFFEARHLATNAGHTMS
ncbi:unnamed protein product [Closterium sp. NIES-54]